MFILLFFFTGSNSGGTSGNSWTGANSGTSGGTSGGGIWTGIIILQFSTWVYISKKARF